MTINFEAASFWAFQGGFELSKISNKVEKLPLFALEGLVATYKDENRPKPPVEGGSIG